MRIREMTWADLDQVMVIENENFSVPWTETGFFTYLMRSDALFLVAEEEDCAPADEETVDFEQEETDYEAFESETCQRKESEVGDADSEEVDFEDSEYEEEYEDCGTIVGYCGIIMAADEGDITNVSVKKEYQGQGIGAALVSELQNRVKELGIQKIFLEVRKSNAPALALYEKQGFEHMGIRKNYYSDPVEDAITMCRNLSH